ncbi:MAG: hypothetical protein KFW21_03205 [Spirochaetota bacterium]|nr:hypothetical protein [Spirochaetota bacterium]
MIRSFTPQDIPDFPNIKILSHTKNKISKDYLLIERPPFISVFINIDNQYGIFIEQYRPIIDKITLEIPMGKIEKFDLSIESALIRELQEECNLFLGEESSFLLVKNINTKAIEKLSFTNCVITAETPNYLSPGFSTSQQYPFLISLSSSSKNISHIFDDYILFSQETDLKVHLKKLNQGLFYQLDGLSRYYLISFLYQQSL